MTDTDRELVDQVVEHRVVTAELRDRRSEAPTADEIAQWAAALPELLTVGSAQQRKALVPKLVKEIRVMGRDEIVPAYRIPSLVSRTARLGGPDRSRTDDLRHAMAALYQLSYGPGERSRCTLAEGPRPTAGAATSAGRPAAAPSAPAGALKARRPGTLRLLLGGGGAYARRSRGLLAARAIGIALGHDR